ARLRRGEVLHADQPVEAHQLREDAADGAPVHLPVHLLAVVARARRERDAAARPQRAARAAVARATGALLAPGLLAAAADVGAVLLRLGAGAGARHVGDQHLVHQRFVVALAEHAVGHLQLAGALAARLSQGEFHRLLLTVPSTSTLPLPRAAR